MTGTLIRRIAVVALTVIGSWFALVDPFTFVFFAAYMVVGAVLALLRPHNVVGWLLILIAFGAIATTIPPDVDKAAVIRGDGSIRDRVILWIVSWAGWTTYLGVVAMTIVFPSGRIPASGRRTSVIMLGIGVTLTVLTAIAPTIGIMVDPSRTVFVPNPFAVAPDLAIWPILQVVTVPAFFALLGIAVVRFVLRYRRSTGLERVQLRWLVAAICFVGVAVAVGIGWIIVFGDQYAGYGWIVAIVAYPTLPLAIGVAVMRYRLLEIDRIISRTVSYFIVTGILGALFVALILLSQTALAGLTGNAGIPVAISTLVVFALFQPVLRRVRHAVDRRFDRARYDGERTAREFAERLRRETDIDRVTSDLRTTAASAVIPRNLDIWLRTGRSNR